jgi:DNA-binding transcriptional regulator YiaG
MKPRVKTAKSKKSAAYVKALRKRLKVTQVELAGRLGVHPVTVRLWESALQNVSPAYLKLMELMKKDAK